MIRKVFDEAFVQGFLAVRAGLQLATPPLQSKSFPDPGVQLGIRLQAVNRLGHHVAIEDLDRESMQRAQVCDFLAVDSHIQSEVAYLVLLRQVCRRGCLGREEVIVGQLNRRLSTVE